MNEPYETKYANAISEYGGLLLIRKNGATEEYLKWDRIRLAFGALGYAPVDFWRDMTSSDGVSQERAKSFLRDIEVFLHRSNKDNLTIGFIIRIADNFKVIPLVPAVYAKKDKEK